MSSRHKFFNLFLVLAASWWFLQPAALSYAQTATPDGPPAKEDLSNETCFACHDDPGSSVHVSPSDFDKSFHGQLFNCVDCHRDVSEIPHAVPLKPVSCSDCHEETVTSYFNSDHVHGPMENGDEAATCALCHGNPHTFPGADDPASPVHRANIAKTCAACHANSDHMGTSELRQAAPVASYKTSVHGLALQEGNLKAAVCSDCHSAHNILSPNKPGSKLYWQNIPQTCGQCHQDVLTDYEQSIHGKTALDGNRDSPVCTDCHGEHSIEAVKAVTSRVYPSRIPETCGQCHNAQRIISRYGLPQYAVETYMDSFHGLAGRMGSLTAANCASCHGYHKILPQDDPRSSINPNNLAKTCGQCHPGVGSLVTQGRIHSGTQPGLENNIALIVRKIYMILILSVVSFMLIHNGLDFLKKLKKHYRSDRGPKMRMTGNERIQHAFLAISFIVLAYTGFALKYPQAWWASPFAGHVDWRRDGHRLGALVFVLLSVYHSFYILISPHGRKHIKALWLRRIDFIQIKETFLYYLGRRPSKPVFGFYGYPEKIEYWALIWGSIVMVVTGVLLLKETWFLAHFPKWLYDVVTTVHYYEAVLACLAILLWHGYFVMFDPDEYPMKMTWLSGMESPADEEREDK